MNIDKLEDFKQIEVVYGIHNTITDKWYIGSTFNLHDRNRTFKIERSYSYKDIV